MLKRIINLVISVAVGTWDSISEQFGRLLGRGRRRSCVVLAYHSVTRDERTKFARQMDVLVQKAKPIRADTQVLPELKRKYAAMTFDDGLECIIENALPELQRRKIPATLFIVTEVLGGYPQWEYHGGDDPSKTRAMSEEQLRKLPSELVSIGSHTMTHPILPRVGGEQLSQELIGSRTKLEQMLNQKIKLLSFPYGAFDEKVVQRCREASYDRVFSALPVMAFSDPHEFVTGRVGVTPTDWPIEFRLKLAGAYRWLPYAYAWKRRILSPFRAPSATPTPAL